MPAPKPKPAEPRRAPGARAGGASAGPGRARGGQDHAFDAHDHAHDSHGTPGGNGASIGRRNTRPRAAIVAILSRALGPLTVPEIHARAQDAETGAKIGIATVYRTLNLLVENGLARQVVLPSGEARYEAAGHKGHHDHFQCVNCARVFDIDACVLGLPSGAVIPGGFRVQGHELTLTGLCPECDKAVGTHSRRPERRPR